MELFFTQIIPRKMLITRPAAPNSNSTKVYFFSFSFFSYLLAISEHTVISADLYMFASGSLPNYLELRHVSFFFIP